MIKVVELFAGIGGFRLGLNQSSDLYRTVWWNQWEPSTKRVQHAWEIYRQKCMEEGEKLPPHTNTDIAQVDLKFVRKHDLLVAGFPCQDYSVATSLDKAGGLQGKKGVLWWEIVRILKQRNPPYILFENVDRLLKSPAKQRGRDFAILLGCLRDLGYCVEWRIINAADYGCRTRRRRIFIFGARADSGIGRFMAGRCRFQTYLVSEGFFASEFRVSFQHQLVEESEPDGELPPDVRDVSADYYHDFANAGVMVDGKFWTRPVTANNEPEVALRDSLDPWQVDKKYFLDKSRLRCWETAKGAKTIERTAKNGHVYLFAEGKMAFPDPLDRASRTILTSEANRTPNRSTHVIRDPPTGRLRFLTPTEVARIMGFPHDWTDVDGISERWRYFTMGNALVVPLVERMGLQLISWISEHEDNPLRERLLQGSERSSHKKEVHAKPVKAQRPK